MAERRAAASLYVSAATIDSAIQIALNAISRGASNTHHTVALAGPLCASMDVVGAAHAIQTYGRQVLRNLLRGKI